VKAYATVGYARSYGAVVVCCDGIVENACCGGDLKAFLHLTNRNLEPEDHSDLVHHLHEKQRRHERFMRGVSAFTPSYAGSAENIDRES